MNPFTILSASGGFLDSKNNKPNKTVEHEHNQYLRMEAPVELAIPTITQGEDGCYFLNLKAGAQEVAIPLGYADTVLPSEARAVLTAYLNKTAPTGPNYREMVVYSDDFSHPTGKPLFQQGGKQHEMQEVVTAEDCTRWIDRIHKLNDEKEVLLLQISTMKNGKEFIPSLSPTPEDKPAAVVNEYPPPQRMTIKGAGWNGGPEWDFASYPVGAEARPKDAGFMWFKERTENGRWSLYENTETRLGEKPMWTYRSTCDVPEGVIRSVSYVEDPPTRRFIGTDIASKLGITAYYPAVNSIAQAEGPCPPAVEEAKPPVFTTLETVACPPHVLMRPQVLEDGDKWCALYGEDIQVGIAGWGDTPAEAMADFDKNWQTARTAKAMLKENRRKQIAQDEQALAEEDERRMVTCPHKNWIMQSDDGCPDCGFGSK